MCVSKCVFVPVIAVEVVQPASFFHQLDGARGVPPGGVAVRAFVLFVLAPLHSALVGLLDLVVDIVVYTLPHVGLPMAQPCSADTHTQKTAFMEDTECAPGGAVQLQVSQHIHTETKKAFTNRDSSNS